MGINKKTFLISWLIGLGSGLFISGIILSILLYTSNKVEEIPQDDTEQVQGLQEVPEVPVLEEPLKDTENIEAEIIEPETIEPETIEQETIQPESIELEIESTATARDITKMLFENGVIVDYNEFLSYIISKNATRSLSHGSKIFPLNSDIESVFNVLAPYK